MLATRAVNQGKRRKNAFTYGEDMKDFWTEVQLMPRTWVLLLCIHERCIHAYTGTAGMEMMRRTMFEGVIPSSDTLSRHITHIIGDALLEAGYTDARLDAAIPFFHKLGYTAGAFIIINDATAVLPAVWWRARDDALIGYALADHDLPLFDIRASESIIDILQHHHRHQLATQVEVVLLCALAPGFPAYALASFPQMAGPTAFGVKQRVEIATREIEKRGGLVLGYAADGAAAQLAYMKEMSVVRSFVFLHLEKSLTFAIISTNNG